MMTKAGWGRDRGLLWAVNSILHNKETHLAGEETADADAAEAD